MSEFFQRLTSSLGENGIADLKSAFQVMWQGMAGIFVVMAAISLIVFIFTKFIKSKK